MKINKKVKDTKKRSRVNKFRSIKRKSLKNRKKKFKK